MTRIVYLLRSYPRSSQTFVLNEIRSVERSGLDVEIVALTRAEDAVRQPVADEIAAPVAFLAEEASAPRVLRAVARLVRDNPGRLLRCALGVARDRAVDAGYTAEGRWRCLVHAIVLADRLRAGPVPAPVHVHAHFAHDPAHVALLASRLTDLTFSFTGHARDLYQIPASALAERVGAAAFVATVTNHNRRLITGVAAGTGTPVHVIPQGTDTSTFTPGDPPDGTADAPADATPGDATDDHPSRPITILAVGRLVPKKGFDVLVEACSRLAGTGCRFECRIVGDGPEAAALQRWIDDDGLGDRVTMVGPVAQADLVDVYRSADVFVLPAVVTSDGDSDALPTVLLEAMACGLPVVTTPVGGIPELVTDGVDGVLVASGSIDPLVEALGRLAADAELRDRLGRAARATVVERFDHAHQVARLVELLRPPARSPAAVGGSGPWS